MPVISARIVKRPTTDRTCGECCEVLAQTQHVLVCGYDRRGTTYRVLFCVDCAKQSGDAKVRRAVANETG